jgi:hypothetical protein
LGKLNKEKSGTPAALKVGLKSSVTWSQSLNRELQRHRSKNFQRN